MPEKSRQQRVKIAKRQGKSTAIKSSDVHLAAGLSTHAAKKSRHVEGMRTIADRSVSRKQPPGQSRTARGRTPTGINESALEPAGGRSPEAPRVAGFDRTRPQQKVISRRSRSLLAAKEARKRK